MKTKKHNLSAIALGVTLAMGSLAAEAAVPVVNPASAGFGLVSAAERASLYPTFEASERTGLALVESALSLIAARTHIDPEFCRATTYSLKVNAFEDEGTALIAGGEGNGGTTLTAYLSEYSKGAQVDVYADEGSELQDAVIYDYEGDHQWSRKSAIFVDEAEWTFIHPQSEKHIPYSENSIKDYFKRVETVDGDFESWEYDWGLEVISKEELPVAKWTELSWYRQQDGNDGYIRVRKDLLSPKTPGALCRIVFVATPGFAPFEDYAGTVTVFRP